MKLIDGYKIFKLKNQLKNACLRMLRAKLELRFARASLLFADAQCITNYIEIKYCSNIFFSLKPYISAH